MTATNPAGAMARITIDIPRHLLLTFLRDHSWIVEDGDHETTIKSLSETEGSSDRWSELLAWVKAERIRMDGIAQEGNALDASCRKATYCTGRYHAFWDVEQQMRKIASHSGALPSDLGYPDDGYDLPALSIIAQPVEVDIESDGHQ